VIDMQGLIKSAVVAKIIPSDKTFGFDKAALREGFAAFFYSDTCYIKYSTQSIVEFGKCRLINCTTTIA
jgi:heptosyltransferase-1